MELDKGVNYIVSGLERSGTSMVMQILQAGGVALGFDSSRKPDESNPKGYYELEGGKIINRLREGNFLLEDFKGRFVKITAYGIKFLPQGNYKVIYIERNIDEVLDSMEKMAGKKDMEREGTKEAFVKLNEMVKEQLGAREDIECLFVNYNNILKESAREIRKICGFLGLDGNCLRKMVKVVDEKLYRRRAFSKEDEDKVKERLQALGYL